MWVPNIGTTKQTNQEQTMSNFVIAFRSPQNNRPDATEEAEWQQWFSEIGGQVANFGHRVGRVSSMGSSTGNDDALAGYVVVQADDFDAALAIAKDCPGLRHGRGIEVGETVQS
jgi:hypothetical protein